MGVLSVREVVRKPLILLEHRTGVEPVNTGFADQRVSHFAIGAYRRPLYAAAPLFYMAEVTLIIH